MDKYTHQTIWNQITYSFSSYNGGTLEVWEWISNFNPHFTGMKLFILIGIKFNLC